MKTDWGQFSPNNPQDLGETLNPQFNQNNFLSILGDKERNIPYQNPQKQNNLKVNTNKNDHSFVEKEHYLQKSIHLIAPFICDKTNFQKTDNYIYEDLSGIIHTYIKDEQSFGITVYTILMQDVPFPEDKELIYKQKILEGKRPEIQNEEIPELFKEIIEKCWNQNPENRPDFSSIVSTLLNTKKLKTLKEEFNEFDEEKIQSFLATCNLNDHILTTLENNSI